MINDFDDLKADDITIVPEGEASTTETETASTETKEEENENESSEESQSSSENEEEAETTSETEESAESETEESNESESTSTESENTTPDFDALLHEKSGGKFKTYSELENQISQLSKNQKTEQEELDNDLIAKFKEFRTGRNGEPKEIAKLFLETQLMDVESFEPMDAIRAKMKLDNPNRSAEDIDFLLQNKYKLNEEEYEADEIRLAKLQMEDDATLARKELKGMQDKIAMKEDKTNKTNKEQQELIKQANEKWQNNVNASLQGYDKVGLPINDKGDQFNFGIDNQEEVTSIMSNLPSFWSRYVSQDKDGNEVENVDQLRDDMTLLTNRDQIFKSIYDQGVSAGMDKIIKERKNPSKKDNQEQTDTSGAKSELDELAEGMGAQLNK